MTVSGKYECITKTPMGDQKTIYDIVVDGDSFSGTNTGSLGTLDLRNGKIVGNRLTWTMRMIKPFPINFEGEVEIIDGNLSGIIKAGVMGSSEITGKRIG
ncbi:hypothetical protein [Microbulbifer pacificus]|uniref:Uncharacterized protein n=1 Tax=Microbulbifer pacificus TaxID=407164 RepID=A0AAU0N619_9GAMM|nr:hypothetical protein [Microbulbifer pacificus]WOX07026.1 hypothetical protein R5R33_07810 [Microbulbifer pacificus]